MPFALGQHLYLSEYIPSGSMASTDALHAFAPLATTPSPHGGGGGPSCVCNGTDYPEWVAVAFRECVFTSRDYLSFWVGLSSLGFWIFAQGPQFYKNCKLQSASGLSIFFLFQWMLGDSLNLCGSVLTGQLGTVIYTSGLFVSMDIILFSQYVLLERPCCGPDVVSPKGEAMGEESGAAGAAAGAGAGARAGAGAGRDMRDPVGESHAWVASPSDASLRGLQPGAGGAPQGVRSSSMRAVLFPMLVVAGLGGGLLGISSLAEEAAAGSPGAHLLRADAARYSLAGRRHLTSFSDPASLVGVPLCDAPASTKYKSLGNVLAWASAGIYLCSRVPQIFKNIKRGSVEGLSPLMFFCAVMGNATYAASMFIKGGDLAGSAPFLTGSLGTLAFDFTILLQFLYYRGRRPRRARHLVGSPGTDAGVPRGLHNIVDWQASPWMSPEKRAAQQDLRRSLLAHEAGRGQQAGAGATTRTPRRSSQSESGTSHLTRSA